jgi:hypothetical protein
MGRDGCVNVEGVGEVLDGAGGLPAVVSLSRSTSGVDWEARG